MTTLNQKQQEAADGFFEFLFTDEPAMIISGKGGSGKSYLVSYLISQVLTEYSSMCQLVGIKEQYKYAVMTATTNKAGEILAEATGMEIDTVHSFMNLTMFEDYKTGKLVLKPNNNYGVINNTIVFIDEYSMINKELFAWILKTFVNCKVVYVGDCNQLPPVKEKITVVQEQGYRMYELEQSVRNSGQPALVNLCDQFIDTVSTGIFNPIQIVPGVIDYLTDNHIGQAITEHFSDPDHNHAILAYYNNQVIEINHGIRTVVRGFPREYVKDEALICNTAVEYQPGKRFYTEEVVHVVNAGLVAQHELGIEVQYLDIRSRNGIAYDVPVSIDNTAYSKRIKHYSSQKDWHKYFALKKIPDLRPSDARTVHKSQGSSYDTVFIDLTDLSKCYDTELAAKLFYVAVSRARNRIIFFGSLNSKYGMILP